LIKVGGFDDGFRETSVAIVFSLEGIHFNHAAIKKRLLTVQIEATPILLTITVETAIAFSTLSESGMHCSSFALFHGLPVAM
jgi:hypothetical protein